jgi:enamine deaminase RidA (YjgF/YER057c/UK114 family)
MHFDLTDRLDRASPTSLRRGRLDFTLTVTPRPGEPAGATFRRLAHDLAAQDAELLAVMIYGGLAIRAEVEVAMHRALGEIQWPVTWVEAESCNGTPLAGVQAFAVSGASVTRVRVGRQIVGSVYDDGDARHCLLGGLGPTAIAGMERPAQVRQMFGNLEWALDAAGFALSDVVRTWFYNDDILAWYADFNRVRTAHYANVPWRIGALPASTGIGARNSAGSAVAVAAWAVQPLRGQTVTREIMSPLQCPARLVGVRAAPVCTHLQRWPRAIPQYTLGYQRFKDAIAQVEATAPGVFIGGNCRDGISLANCIASGRRLAAAVVAYTAHVAPGATAVEPELVGTDATR